jgi:hypothetical protein
MAVAVAVAGGPRREEPCLRVWRRIEEERFLTVGEMKGRVRALFTSTMSMVTSRGSASTPRGVSTTMSLMSSIALVWCGVVRRGVAESSRGGGEVVSGSRTRGS